MTLKPYLPVVFSAVTLLFVSACGTDKNADDSTKTMKNAAADKATPAEAKKFIAQINADYKKNAPINNAAYWSAATYINGDTQLLASQATERSLAYLSEKLEASKRFNGVEMDTETARAMSMLKQQTAMPAPSDAKKREELAKIAARMEANYGSGKWCPDESKPDDCMSLPEIEKIVNDYTLSPGVRAEAWAGWHATSLPIKEDYARFVELINEGASEMGFANAGELWRGGYDMSPADFRQETERLWTQVKPLYEELHCYVRGQLNSKYPDVVKKDGKIPSHLLGNMWAQQWSNIYEQIIPYKGVGDLDVTSALKKMRDREYKKQLAAFSGSPTAIDIANISHKADAVMAKKMTEIAEDFYTSIGFPELPDNFYNKSLLVKPRDRDVVCHASAWDIDLAGDVRIKQCIEPDEEQLYTIHHELGHIYYYLVYNHLPPIFQTGAHDGFHEAVGDTITLSLTPQHMKKIGLVESVENNQKAIINSQMKLALDKIVFLPWGKLVDMWRWKVFAGEVSPEEYNDAWWKLREEYQGVSAPLERSSSDFDPGAKYHIPGNTPYTRYFLSFILQFQFQRELCNAAGFDGPLHECDIYGNEKAGKKFIDMLSLGASQPWQDSLEKLTGKREMDATAIIEYFEPLMGWLKEQNQGQQCGW